MQIFLILLIHFLYKRLQITNQSLELKFMNFTFTKQPFLLSKIMLILLKKKYLLLYVIVLHIKIVIFFFLFKKRKEERKKKVSENIVNHFTFRILCFFPSQKVNGNKHIANIIICDIEASQIFSNIRKKSRF